MKAPNNVPTPDAIKTSVTVPDPKMFVKICSPVDTDELSEEVSTDANVVVVVSVIRYKCC